MEKIAEFLFQIGFSLSVLSFFAIILAVGRLTDNNSEISFVDKVVYIDKNIDLSALKIKIQNRPRLKDGKSLFKILIFYIVLCLSDFFLIFLYLCLYIGFICFFLGVIMYGFLLF